MEALRELSRTTGRSIADLTRDALNVYLEQKRGSDRQALVEQALSIAGRFASGIADVSSEHDRYFAETLTPNDIR